jgi:hypothetical protein
LKERERLFVGQSMAMSKEAVHVRIDRPTVAIPDLEGDTA